MSFPFCSGDLLFGEKQGIGLCTLWSPRKQYKELLPCVKVIGNLYSRFGIGILIRNVLACNIQHIIITGVDNPEPAKRQADNLIRGDFNPAELYLTSEQVSEFYKRVKIHDCRNMDKAALVNFIAALAISDTYPEPLLIPLPEVKQTVYPTARSGHSIRANSIAAAHLRLLKELRTFGEYTAPDSENHIRQELWGLTVTLSQTADYSNCPGYSDAEIVNYGSSLWEGDEPEGLTYKYGHTMRHLYGDQIQTVLEAFKKKPETYRTVISLWEPLQSILRDDEPCLTTVHPRIRNGVLDMCAYIRTNEMFRGWPKNAAGLRFLQYKFAKATNTVMGELMVTSGSAHIYDIDWPAIDSYLKNNPSSGFTFDPKGDWHIYKDAGYFIGEHYKDGILLQTVKSTNIEQFVNKIGTFVSDVSHGIYIGREIERIKNS